MSDESYLFSESYTYRPDTTVATTNAGGGEANLSDYDMETYWRGNNPNIVLYAGTGSDGNVFISINGGTTWANTGNLAGATYVYSLIQAADGTLYAGVQSGSVFKSTDGGTTWTDLGMIANAIYSLLETSGGVLYAGTGAAGNIYKSTDNGETWIETGELTDAVFVWDIIEAADGTLYAGAYTTTEACVFKSIDGGTIWTATGNLANAQEAFCLLQNLDGTLFAGTYPNGDIFRSIDDGTTWTKQTGVLTGATEVFCLLRASDGTLYAGTGSANGDVFKSVDGGVNWVATGNLVDAIEVRSLLQAVDGTLYAGTTENGNVFKSIDGGTIWTNTENLTGATHAFSLLQTTDSDGPCEIVWTFSDTQTIDAIWFKGYNISTYQVYAWIAAAWHLVDTVVVTAPLTSYNLHIFDHTHQSSSWKLAITLTASPGVPLVYEGMLMKYHLTLSDTDDSLPSGVEIMPVDRAGGSYQLADGSQTSFRGVRIYHDITYEFEFTPKANRDNLYNIYYSITYGIRPNIVIYPDPDEYPEGIYRVVWKSTIFDFAYTINYKGSGFSGKIELVEY